MKPISTNYDWQLGDFMKSEKSFVSMKCGQKASPFHCNTHSVIILIKSVNLAPQQDSALPLLSHDTSQLSSDHGDGLTVTTLWARCCLPTSVLTNSTQHAMLSCIQDYSLLPMLLRQYLC